MLNEYRVVWCIRALYALSLTDSALSSFNLEGSDVGLFSAQIGVHLAFLTCAVLAVSCAAPEATRNKRLHRRLVVGVVISVIKFGLLFLYFVPEISFYGNFIFYAYLIELGFACLTP